MKTFYHTPFLVFVIFNGKNLLSFRNWGSGHSISILNFGGHIECARDYGTMVFFKKMPISDIFKPEKIGTYP